MIHLKRLFLYIVSLALVSFVYAQTDITAVDTIQYKNINSTPTFSPVIDIADTATMTQKEIDRLFWQPDPVRAVWLGAVVPGLGQIYNRSYWKVPIVYGGFMGCAYAITWTNDQYIGYKNAYRDIYYDIRDGKVSNDPSKSYIAILPEGYTIDRMGGTSAYRDRLKEWQSRSRRNRDLAIAATAIVYALTLVDAYVDAQLFDFDISTDLSLNMYPNIYYDDMQHQRTAEVKLAIIF